MATTGTSHAKKPAQPGLVITRLFDAPRELVFKAWTDPERLARWWGPHGFTTPYCTIDLRQGGAWHLCMRSPDGQDYWCKGIYQEIVVPERLVSTDFFSDAEGNPVPPTHYGMSADFPAETLITVTLAEHEGKTKLTLEHTIPASIVEESGAREGWSQSLDRLAEELQQV
jgi:uncharacterized protein YndB with AHSA1/START domain